MCFSVFNVKSSHWLLIPTLSSGDNIDLLYFQCWANTKTIKQEIYFFFRQSFSHVLLWVLKEMVLSQARCVLLYVCTVPTISSNNQFLGVLDALEWWERKSSDTQPSRNENIKWLPQRNCCIFKCLWEYLPSLSAFPLHAARQHLKSFLLTYVISLGFSAAHSLVKWLFRPAGCP